MQAARESLLTSAASIPMRPAADPNELLTPKQVSADLRCAEKTLERMRRDGGGPRFIRAGARKILYRRAAVLDWLAEREFAHRAAEAA